MLSPFLECAYNIIPPIIESSTMIFEPDEPDSVGVF